MKLNIKGDIASWNDSIVDFENTMKNIDENEPLEIECNSYGGDVFLGINIANMIRGHKGETTVTVTGIAASAASIIAASADKVRMYSSSQIMVHLPWTIAAGNSNDFRKLADDLDSIGESVLNAYSHRGDKEVIRGLVENETFLTAEQAITYGLADEIIDAKAEVVQSKLFRNEVEKFNNTIVETVEDNEQLKQEINTLKSQVLELQNQLNQPKEEPIEQPKVAAKRKGFFF